MGLSPAYVHTLTFLGLVLTIETILPWINSLDVSFNTYFFPEAVAIIFFIHFLLMVAVFRGHHLRSFRVKAKIIESLACIYLFGTLIVNDLLLADVISESREFEENEDAQEQFAILRFQRIFPIICAVALCGVSMLRSLRYRRLTSQDPGPRIRAFGLLV